MRLKRYSYSSSAIFTPRQPSFGAQLILNMGPPESSLIAKKPFIINNLQLNVSIKNMHELRLLIPKEDEAPGRVEI